MPSVKSLFSAVAAKRLIASMRNEKRKNKKSRRQGISVDRADDIFFFFLKYYM